jgi:hypothetical protein
MIILNITRNYYRTLSYSKIEKYRFLNMAP